MTTTTPRPSLDPDPASEPDAPAAATLRRSVDGYVARVRGGDVGSLPAVLGLVVLAIVFSALRPGTFTNPFNFANLINQGAPVIVIAMGLVFVLLLGEIDLSAGFAAGVAGAVMGVFLTTVGLPWPVAIILGLVTGVAIGALIGVLVAYVGIPSFVVTLAAFLGFQGLLLIIIGEGGTIAYRDPVVLGIMNANLPVWVGWLLYVVGVAAYALLTLRTSVGRRREGLSGDPLVVWAVKTVALALILGLVTWYLSIERSRNVFAASLKGVPFVVVIVVVLLIGLTFLLNRTAWGRHVYAVGGNAEAARRAGIDVAWIRLSCFILCSTLAAVAGIMLGSRDNSISPSTGGSTTLLYAVGAAVIGGASLFGGKGRIIDAVIGGAVVAVIDNGMLLLKQPAGNVYLVTGAVLLIAAGVDALSRRRSAASGRG